jgi:enoyl-[acyl-carrier protein] reductase I
VLELHPMAHRAEPLMKNGGTLFTMTYYGSQMAVKNYNIMGVALAIVDRRGSFVLLNVQIF